MTDKQTLDSLKKIFGISDEPLPEIENSEWDKSIDKLRELLGMSNGMDKKD